MSSFNNTDLSAFKNVWVFCEQRNGEMMPTSYELISEGRRLADELKVELVGVLLGEGVMELAPSIGGYGADRVIVCDHPLLKDYTTDGYTKVLSDMIEEYKPEVVLFGATNIGRDLGPRCAARLHTGLCADCTHLDVDMDIYKDFANNTEYPATVAKVKKNMYDAYTAAGFTEDQALALMINDNIQLMDQIKKASSKVNRSNK